MQGGGESGSPAGQQEELGLWEGEWRKELGSFMDKIGEQMRGGNNDFLEGKGVGRRKSAK